ncbi:MAG TPA: hypothetical protein P5293_02030 [Bacteroidales bacterium]|nr:hypothetical protein [Bacteroidales bacterium]
MKILENKKAKISGKMNEEYLVVHIISDETGKNICDVKLSLQEVLNLVEYAIKDIFKRLENNVKNKTEKRDVL